MPPGPRPVWRSKARSLQPGHVDANLHINTNTNIHIHILPRTPTPKFDNSSGSISTPLSSTPTPTPTSTSPETTPTQASSLWSSLYGAGTGGIIAGVIDAGLVLILMAFLGVVYIQWKKQTGAVPPTPSKNNPKTGEDQTPGQGVDAGVLVQVDSHGHEKGNIGTPTLVARSGSASESERENERDKVRQSDIEERFSRTEATRTEEGREG